MTSRRGLATAATLVALLGFAPACASASTRSTPASSPAASASVQPTTAATTQPTAQPDVTDVAGRTASAFAGSRVVGALFPSALVPFHICSASVIASANKSVIMTAAHCVRGGHDAGYAFAPGYHDGKAPYGFWTVTAAYGAPAWVKHTSNHDDFAFLVVAPRMINGVLTRLQSVTGAVRLGARPKKGVQVTVPAYPLGNGGPIRCTAKVFYQGVFPGFHCGGYVDGTSGAPWLVGSGSHRRMVGLVSGLHQGGCTPSTSYSSPLGSAAAAALKRAAHSKPGDTFPSPPGDGC
jgi:hypothetical protein